MNGSVDAVLMASGLSHRFGKQNKLLFSFLGKPLAAHALELMCKIQELQKIWFVCGDPAVLSIGQTYPTQIIYNKNPNRGMSESIRLGVLHSQADYYLFVPCDQPFLDTQTIKQILSARRPERITCPTYQGQRGSPVLFSSVFRSDLLALDSDCGGKKILRSYPEAVQEIEIQNSLAFLDIDTPEELHIATDKYSKGQINYLKVK